MSTKTSRAVLLLLFYSSLLNSSHSQSLDVNRGSGEDVLVGNSTLASVSPGRKLMKTWDLRFNKFDCDVRGFKPLLSQSYPIHGNIYDVLYETDATDVMMVTDERLSHCDVPKMIEKLGGLPSYPEDDENAEFWDQLRHVIDMQEMRKKSPETIAFPRSELWGEKDLHDCAMAVHNEEPGTIQQELIDALLDEQWGYVEFDRRIVGDSCDERIPWDHFEDAIDDLNLWAHDTVMPPVFAAKWWAGRARPEEVIWAIKKGEISKGVPKDIKRYARSLDIDSAHEFTAYEEGCPTHPSWPAMHAAAGSCSLWMPILLDMDDEQLCQARLTDYAIAYARTVAGVHYPDDNIVGLNFAQEIIAKELPKYLKEAHGADPRYVAWKVNKYKFDWNDFDPEDPCPFLDGGHDFCYD